MGVNFLADTIAGKYDIAFFTQLMTLIKGDYPEFHSDRFMGLIFDEQWEQRPFKQRIRHISDTLRLTLPPSYREALQILDKIAPQCTGVEYLFFPDFVEVYGLDDWEASIPALERYTPYSSSEFAVRPFILQDPERMLRQLLQWTGHDDHHIRRLASEGCRPRLPWGKALEMYKADPTPILPILERLKADPSLYVRKSVANNLNDIAKDHPELVKELARSWYGDNERTDWVIKHGCRSLLRSADAAALALFGFSAAPDAAVSSLSLDNDTVAIGDALSFRFTVRAASSAPLKLRVEYGIDFVKSSGKTSRKLFKVTENDFGQTDRLYVRTHSFKDLTTRKHYPGKHRLAIVLNGVEMASAGFEVTSNKVL
jgi:3-methyladenine DNA glycosylase AlkC